MKKSEFKQLIKEEIIKQKILEEKNQKASKINQNLSNLIEKMKKDFNIEDEQLIKEEILKISPAETPAEEPIETPAEETPPTA
jgi:hypothetical protein